MFPTQVERFVRDACIESLFSVLEKFPLFPVFFPESIPLVVFSFSKCKKILPFSELGLVGGGGGVNNDYFDQSLSGKSDQTK